MSRPRILYLTPHSLHARSCGSQLRALQIARLLQRIGDVRIVLVGWGHVEEADLAKTRSEFELSDVMRVSRAPIRTLRDRLRRELDPWFLNTHGWSLDPVNRSRITDLIAGSDLTWFFGIATPNNIGIKSIPRSVLDVDDVPSQWHRTHALTRRSLLERALLLRQAWQWRRREALFLERFSAIAVCSEADRRYLGDSSRIHTIPNGFAVQAGPSKRRPASPPRVGFIGSLGYSPNLEGVKWFLERAWPQIRTEISTARLRLVGAGTESLNSPQDAHVDGLGWIEDPAAEIDSWSLMIVPIRAGGGTRVKVAEGLARSCPIVATHLGAFGYELAPGKEILLSNSPDQFAHACLSILRNPEFGEALARRGLAKYQSRWTWDAIAPRVEAAVGQALGGFEPQQPTFSTAEPTPHRAEFQH